MTDYSSRAATRRASLNTGSRMPAAMPVTIYQVNGGSYHVETTGERRARELLEKLGLSMPTKPQPPAKLKVRKRTAHLAAPVMVRVWPRPRTDEQRQRDKMYRRMRRALERYAFKGENFLIVTRIGVNGLWEISIENSAKGGVHWWGRYTSVYEGFQRACKTFNITFEDIKP